MSSSLLTTKLFKPQARFEVVNRQKLLTILDQGLIKESSMTLISAPAGYGKTTLAADWVASLDRKSCWFSLDSGDNDPQRFYRYLVKSLQTINDLIGLDLNALLQSPQLPNPQIVGELLINDVLVNQTALVLVLDDYHVITNDTIHKTIEYLIDNSPNLFHVVIVTRQDPPLHLGRWRVRNKMSEVRVDHLRFNPDEAEVFFGKTMRIDLNKPNLDTLVQRTEGWVAGLQLAALSLQGLNAEGIDSFIAKFSGTNRYLIDYLLEEVLHLQEAEIKEFLIKTSFLNRLNASLCDTVLETSASKRIITVLEHANLFLIPLDDSREWFRYHHLFSEFLRSELSLEQQKSLMSKASIWFADHGLKADAIDYALGAGDIITAVSLMKELLNSTLMKGEQFTLIQWLDALPAKIVESDTELCSYKACAHFLMTQIDKAGHYLNTFQTIDGAQIDSLSLGRIKTLLAWLANIREDRAVIPLATEALELMGEKDLGLKVFALVAYAQGQRSFGDLIQSTLAFREALRISTEIGYTLSIATVTMDLVYNYYIQGKLSEAHRICIDSLTSNEHDKKLPSVGVVYIPLSILFYERNELEQAEAYVNKGIEVTRSLAMGRLFGGDELRTLAKIRFAQGRREEALAVLEQALQVYLTMGLPMSILRFETLRADFWLRMGDTVRAMTWAQHNGITPQGEVTSLKEQSYLVLVRCLLRTGDWVQAERLLTRLETFCLEGGRDGRLINVMVLKSLLHEKTRFKTEAEASMQIAVEAAATEGFIRPFVDEGEEVIPILMRIRTNYSGFIDKILSAHQNQGVGVRTSAPTQDTNLLPESLSGRELDVLRLVANGLSNEEIAQTLYISIGTVKWHMNHILAKLGVKNRTQAINAAKEKGLL